MLEESVHLKGPSRQGGRLDRQTSREPVTPKVREMAATGVVVSREAGPGWVFSASAQVWGNAAPLVITC